MHIHPSLETRHLGKLANVKAPPSLRREGEKDSATALSLSLSLTLATLPRRKITRDSLRAAGNFLVLRADPPPPKWRISPIASRRRSPRGSFSLTRQARSLSLSIDDDLPIAFRSTGIPRATFGTQTRAARRTAPLCAMTNKLRAPRTGALIHLSLPL